MPQAAIAAGRRRTNHHSCLTTTNDVSPFKHYRKVEHRQGPATRALAPVRTTIYSLVVGAAQAGDVEAGTLQGREQALFVWARIIESEKPVFTPDLQWSGGVRNGYQ